MAEFVEWTSKTPKPYKCKKCKEPIQYAKFFGSDKKLLTTDGKEPWFDNSKIPMSNTGWPTDPLTKQMHNCPSDPGPIEKTGNEPDGTKQTPLSELDKKVMDKIIDDAYHDAQLMIGTLTGVERACKELSIEVGPISGMIFKEVCENIRRRNERE